MKYILHSSSGINAKSICSRITGKTTKDFEKAKYKAIDSAGLNWWQFMVSASDKVCLAFLFKSVQRKSIKKGFQINETLDFLHNISYLYETLLQIYNKFREYNPYYVK